MAPGGLDRLRPKTFEAAQLRKLHGCLSGVYSSSAIVTRFGMLTELSPDSDVTGYFGITGLVLTPFTLVASLGGGYLIEQVGYEWVLVGALASVGASLAVLVWKVQPGCGEDHVPAPTESGTRAPG